MANTVNTVYFSVSQIEEMGIFLASLVKNGIAWTCKENISGWTITLTGF